MSTFLERVAARARADRKHIVLPEGSDRRTVEAARMVVDREIADITVLGDADVIGGFGINLDGITVIDPDRSLQAESLADELYELRRAKGMTREQAARLIGDELYHGVMLVKTGVADGMVAGAAHSTSDTLRPALQILKTAPGTRLVSAFFVIAVPDCPYGADGVFVFADSGLVENPDAEALSEIALASAASFESLVGDTAQVAMLSYSTKGSAHSDLTEKVVQATRLAREKRPDIRLDGELQLDAAIVPAIGASKAPGSTVAGNANVLVFPDLNSGNIAYKLAQRLARAEAYGPVTQGIAAPVNDLSRGCSAEDIVGVVAITAVQAQAQRN
ncbi:MAG: phosphate acetyltransferase [Actinomycetes bacterium]|jgi:phosphate acetyltransferase|nr:phosphate acetyltransferase [Actinomycetes bacterium]